jgi:hypothetical protein
LIENNKTLHVDCLCEAMEILKDKKY